MSGDVHVRICEHLGGRFPGVTRLSNFRLALLISRAVADERCIGGSTARRRVIVRLAVQSGQGRNGSRACIGKQLIMTLRALYIAGLHLSD